MAISYALTEAKAAAVYRLISKHRTLNGAKKAYHQNKKRIDENLRVILLGNHGEFVRALSPKELIV